MRIVLFEDKLGITEGYREVWNSLLFGAGIHPDSVIHRSIWRTPTLSTHRFLTKKGNRKSPGFNEEPIVQQALGTWAMSTLQRESAEFCMCMDTALLGLIEPRWDIATIDNLRGGVYGFRVSETYSIPWLVVTPISAIHTQKKPKDIRTMNDGAESEEEFEEDEDRDPEEFFLEPYTIPYGKMVLAADLKKAFRVIRSLGQ